MTEKTTVDGIASALKEMAVPKESPSLYRESPTITERTPAPEAPPESVNDDIQRVLNQLGIDSPERLEGIYKASKEAGNMAQHLGTARAENQRLKEQLQNMGAINPSSQGLTLESLDSWADSRENKSREADNRYYTAIERVKSDPEYHLVGQAFETFMAKPKAKQGVQEGKLSPEKVFTTMIRTYYREIMSLQTNTINEITSMKQSAPFIEGSGTYSPQDDSPKVASEKAMANMTNPEKGWTGSDDDVTRLVKAQLGDFMK